MNLKSGLLGFKNRVLTMLPGRQRMSRYFKMYFLALSEEELATYEKLNRQQQLISQSLPKEDQSSVVKRSITG